MRCIVPKAVHTVKKCSWEWASLSPETCWAELKRFNKRKICCVLLVVYIVELMMHGHTNISQRLLQHTLSFVICILWADVRQLILSWVWFLLSFELAILVQFLRQGPPPYPPLHPWRVRPLCSVICHSVSVNWSTWIFNVTNWKTSTFKTLFLNTQTLKYLTFCAYLFTFVLCKVFIVLGANFYIY